MARTSISYIKSRFETGDRPTQEDYIDLIDTLSAASTDLGSTGNNESTITGIENATVVDTFSALEWRSVKYHVSMSKTSDGDNKFYATQIDVLVDSDGVSVTEYGIIDNDGNMGTISVSRNGDTVALTVTPLPSVRPITVRYHRTGLKA
jgi:hypothetical protein